MSPRPVQRFGVPRCNLDVSELPVKDDELKEAVVVAMLVSPGRRVIA
jgi:hypothetical protein